MHTPSTFWDIFESTARAVLVDGNQAANEMQRVVEMAAGAQRLAFYPCNRYSRKILNHLEKHHPEIFARVVGVFEKNDNLNFRKDIPLFKPEEIHGMNPDRLIIATSKFPADLLPDISAIGFPPEKTFVTSLFREELSHISLEELLSKARRVVDILTDNKSKATYLLTWLSLLLLDKNILSVYFQPANMAFQPNGTVRYHDMTLSHISDANLQYSLFLEIYRMEHVSPAIGDTVLDIGAYRGDTAAFFRKYVGERGRVYAFEPDEINHRYLVENISANKLDNVFPVPKALLDKNTNCNLISTPESGSFLFVIKDALDTNSYSEIEATTVDDFVADQKINRIDFIKSDIEGCEQEMLQGARATIQRHHPKLALAIYHSIHDLLDIPLLVHEMNPDYRLYIRHWNFENSPWEILLYATPEK